ncbi:hypothetical protein CC86DRAFT_386646 [Ophiobolus disseminans]|uniref:Uncharacterized protein n=1 Tax=Ophiobolus disseminans TaxID=1469910 RepID=A0A6A6ZL89_9PLEO|nr:hypothetical protein CC86DRAFT_386646 [Ophiobolus disseminans]
MCFTGDEDVERLRISAPNWTARKPPSSPSLAYPHNDFFKSHFALNSLENSGRQTMGYSSQLQKRDGDRSPCPSNSPPNIGSTQKFSVSCGLDRPYSDSDRVIASSLLDCVNLCARSDLVATSGHRCEAVVYEASAAHGAKNCYLKSSAPPSLQQAFVIDSAVAIWPTNNQLDCDDISEDVQAQKGFQKYCGQDYPYNDDVKYNANSLASCVDLCAARGISCAGVSYEASMAHGYHNCYLKSAVGRNNLVTQAFRVDSAFLVRGNAVTSSARATAQNTLSPLGTGPSSSTVTLLTISSSASSGSVTTTPALQIPLASASSPSRVWIAGAVIGPLALLAIAGLLASIRLQGSGSRDVLSVRPWRSFRLVCIST